jgi:hypothetical protein
VYLLSSEVEQTALFENIYRVTRDMSYAWAWDNDDEHTRIWNMKVDRHQPSTIDWVTVGE